MKTIDRAITVLLTLLMTAAIGLIVFVIFWALNGPTPEQRVIEGIERCMQTEIFTRDECFQIIVRDLD